MNLGFPEQRYKNVSHHWQVNATKELQKLIATQNAIISDLLCVLRSLELL